jgi:UDP-glucose-4-epimerase GalE
LTQIFILWLQFHYFSSPIALRQPAEGHFLTNSYIELTLNIYHTELIITNMNTGKRILVTGGAGYIGSHTCKLLFQQGYSPIVYDNLITGHRSSVKWGDFIYGDIQDSTKLIDVLRNYKPEAVIHFAAFAYVGESVTDPAKYYKNNLSGTLSLLEALRITGVNKIIFSSTCATYGEPVELPIPESHPQNPINPYGRSKLMIENILEDYSQAYQMKYVALRYFNAAGADPDAEIGEDHDPETHLIPLVLDAASGKREGISIFGDDYPTKDGSCIRDYIHVNDLGQAHLNALTYLIAGGTSNQFNLGNGRGFSVKEIIDTVKSVTGLDFPVSIKPRRAGDPPVLIGDASKAEKVLDWKPAIPKIEEIIETAWKWHNRS